MKITVLMNFKKDRIMYLKGMVLNDEQTECVRPILDSLVNANLVMIEGETPTPVAVPEMPSEGMIDNGPAKAESLDDVPSNILNEASDDVKEPKPKKKTK